MPFVDPERFKRFEQFISRHARAFAGAANWGFSSKGRGAVIYHAPDDRFEGTLSTISLHYKTQAEINAAQGETHDELIQGPLERYQPPTEAVFIALYSDQSYDITRVTLGHREGSPPSNTPKAPHS